MSYDTSAIGEGEGTRAILRQEGGNEEPTLPDLTTCSAVSMAGSRLGLRKMARRLQLKANTWVGNFRVAVSVRSWVRNLLS